MIAVKGLVCPACKRVLPETYELLDGTIELSPYLSPSGFICTPAKDGCGRWWVVIDDSLVPATEESIANLSPQNRTRLAMVLRGELPERRELA